jgi:hypothetical protein
MVTLCSTSTRTLTFENFWQRLGINRSMRAYNLFEEIKKDYQVAYACIYVRINVYACIYA